jgi:pimeloyl-[acyl-carrier protein] methyl ester esterase
LITDMPGQAILCGWSLGGQIALDLAHRYPERVSRLVLIGTTPRFVSLTDDEHSRNWPYGLDAAMVRSFIEGFELDPTTTLRRFIALQTLGDRERRMVGAHLAGALSDAGPAYRAGLAAGLGVLSQADLRERTTSIHQPALVLHGANDALMPANAALWLADHLCDARLHLIDDCGHAPFLSRPEECASLIEDFIRE